jgi:hypothetical protein
MQTITTNKTGLKTIIDTIESATTYKAVTNLLSKGATNIKTAKNEIETYILYMAPADIIGIANLCPFASPGCKKACLYSAGRGKFSNVQQSRINKAKFWALDRKQFYIQLTNEILKIDTNSKKTGNKIAIRLNGTTDIDHMDLIKRYTGVDFLQPFYSNLLFYEYTKNPNTVKKYLNTSYKITFSRSEINEAAALEVLRAGGNVAAVFNQLPETWNGYKVINGDLSDLRYFDPKNVVVGLLAKGEAKKDISGFVVTN